MAIAITIIFGMMAAETLSAGAGMWRDGNRRAYAYDTATVVFQQIQDDLKAAKSQFWGTGSDAYDPRIKFWGDRDVYSYKDYQGNARVAHRSWMRFVRAIPDYSTSPRLRSAGTDPTAGADPTKGWYNLIDTTDPLRPLEGMCEVAYMMGLGTDGSTLPNGSPADTDPDTLYRAVLAPIGHTSDASGSFTTANEAGMTFFNTDAWENGTTPTLAQNYDALGTSARFQAKALPLAQGVIYFGVRYWTQYTTSWVPATWNGPNGTFPGNAYLSAGDMQALKNLGLGQKMPFAAWLNNYSETTCGSLLSWDSSRIPGADTPDFAMDEGQNNLGQQATENYIVNGVSTPRTDAIADNVFPRSIMVTVTIEPPSELSVANPLRLRTPITDPTSTADLQVIGKAPPLNSDWPYVKIDDEWVRIKSMQGNTIQVDMRGARGTEAADHAANAPVLIGYTFSRVFNNPAAREYWGQ